MTRRAHKIALSLGVLLLLNCATSSRFRPAKIALDHPLDYPLSAQIDRVEGEVVVGVFVNANGTPGTVRILEPSGHAVLDTAAYQFVKTLAFDPAIIDDSPVGSWTKLVLRYKLTNVAFEREKWARDVSYLQKRISSLSDSTSKAEYQRKLYVRYIGLLDYVRKYNALDINYTIKGAIQKSTAAEWRDFWPEIVSPFALFDDFIRQYPNSRYAGEAKEELIRLLIEAEGDIRVKALHSRKIAQNAAMLIGSLEKRLNELQNAKVRSK